MAKRKLLGSDPWPEQIRPKLVALAGAPPAGDWLYEIKFDGYRFMARISERVTLLTRNGHDWTNRPGQRFHRPAAGQSELLQLRRHTA